ncbi:hypothetical protein LMG29542_08453 [Paraburkholderia humisilvae]|uniref:Uncharacterized protein n=1 Tax=Paraburkholderia humisilvae TaxID=627669 RepID=A0A6J5FB90_9BURK|nr:hypothetical protein LMG29542_08453 [Paraburkholderia humisilvae]
MCHAELGERKIGSVCNDAVAILDFDPVGRELVVDPRPGFGVAGRPHRAMNDRVGRRKQIGKQMGADKSGRTGQEDMARLLQPVDIKRLVQHNGRRKLDIVAQLMDGFTVDAGQFRLQP